MTLSKTQQRALNKLSDKWQSAYSLQESMATLRSLVRKGLVESTGSNNFGALFSPPTEICFRQLLKEVKDKDADVQPR